MRIAHAFFAVAPDQREKALDIMISRAAAVREMPGCRVFVPFSDPADPGKLGVIHEWESGADFDAYLASPVYAAISAVLRPMMIGKPDGRRFDAALLQTVN